VEPRVSLITLGVSDLERAVAFYQDGLGWPKSEVGGDEVAFFKTGGMVISLFPRTSFAADAGLWRCAVILDQLLLPTSGGGMSSGVPKLLRRAMLKKSRDIGGVVQFH
jgi:hypothetical protein